VREIAALSQGEDLSQLLIHRTAYDRLVGHVNRSLPLVGGRNMGVAGDGRVLEGVATRSTYV
jgi:hypothetical protein